MTEVQNVLRLLSTLACMVVIAAFAMWATDEGRAASDQQVAQVNDNGSVSQAPSPGVTAEPERGGVRGEIEDLNDALLSPFDHIAQDGSEWAAHGVPALLALLTYGLLGRILIAYLPR
jgi:hypothetical protein